MIALKTHQKRSNNTKIGIVKKKLKADEICNTFLEALREKWNGDND